MGGRLLGRVGRRLGMGSRVFVGRKEGEDVEIGSLGSGFVWRY